MGRVNGGIKQNRASRKWEVWVYTPDLMRKQSVASGLSEEQAEGRLAQELTKLTNKISHLEAIRNRLSEVEKESGNKAINWNEFLK